MLRKAGTERAFTGEYTDTETTGVEQVPRVRGGAVQVGHEVPLGLRLAVVLPAGRGRRGHADRGPVVRHRPHRGALRALRLPPRARVHRRGVRHADRRALVHQLGLADARAEGSGGGVAARPLALASRRPWPRSRRLRLVCARRRLPSRRRSREPLVGLVGTRGGGGGATASRSSAASRARAASRFMSWLRSPLGGDGDHYAVRRGRLARRASPRGRAPAPAGSGSARTSNEEARLGCLVVLTDWPPGSSCAENRFAQLAEPEFTSQLFTRRSVGHAVKAGRPARARSRNLALFCGNRADDGQRGQRLVDPQS